MALFYFMNIAYIYNIQTSARLCESSKVAEEVSNKRVCVFLV